MRELAPRDADDAPAGRGERAVAGAVALEVAPCRVDAVAVELDDQAMVRPGGVDSGLARDRDGHVRQRARELMVGREGEEGDLEVALRDRTRDLVSALQDPDQCRRPATAGVPRDEVADRGGTREAQAVRLGDRGREVLGTADAGKVEQRARDRGRRDSLAAGHLVRRQRAAVRLDPGPACLARSGDLDPRTRRRADLPERGGGAVAQDRVGADGEDRSDP